MKQYNVVALIGAIGVMFVLYHGLVPLMWAALGVCAWESWARPLVMGQRPQ